MKRVLIFGVVLAASLSFNANAGVWSDIQDVYLDAQNWFVQAIKPGKPEW